MSESAEKPYKVGKVTVYPPKGTKKSWRLRWFAGQQHERTFSSKEEAERHAERLALELRHDPLVKLQVASRLTVREVGDAYVASLPDGRYRERQANSLRMWVYPSIGDMRLLSWTPADSESVLRKMGEAGRAPSYMRNIGAAMRAVATYARKKRWLTASDEDPMFGVKYTPKSKVQGESVLFVSQDTLPTWDDLQKLFDAWRSLGLESWALAWELVARSGLRWGELIALRPEDLDLSNRIVNVSSAVEETCAGSTRRKSTKNGMVRHSIVPASLVPRLEAYAKTVAPGSTLFPAPQGGFARRGRHRKDWIRAAEKAGWPMVPAKNGQRPRWTPHDLRHFAACWMLYDLKAEPAQVAFWLGHHNVSFTIARYVGVRGDILEAGKKLTEEW